MSNSVNYPELKLTQIAWVVPDIEKSKSLFRSLLGITNFSPTDVTRLQEYRGTYYDELADAENLVTMTYSGGNFIEIIQPLSGKSIFADCIRDNPSGIVHHIAYSTPLKNLETVINKFENEGYKIISSFDTPIAKIVFFDTREQFGVFTEIMGIAEDGEKVVQQMKIELS